MRKRIAFMVRLRALRKVIKSLEDQNDFLNSEIAKQHKEILLLRRKAINLEAITPAQPNSESLTKRGFTYNMKEVEFFLVHEDSISFNDQKEVKIQVPEVLNMLVTMIEHLLRRDFIVSYKHKGPEHFITTFDISKKATITRTYNETTKQFTASCEMLPLKTAL